MSDVKNAKENVWMRMIGGLCAGLDAWDRARNSYAWKSFRKLIGKPVETPVVHVPTEAEAKSAFAARTLQRDPDNLVQIRRKP